MKEKKSRKFRDLEFWKYSMALAKKVLLLKNLPEPIESQIHRAVISVPANIAEGVARGRGYTVNAFRIARGSLAEVETLLRLSEQIGVEETFAKAFDLITLVELQLDEAILELGSITGSVGWKSNS